MELSADPDSRDVIAEAAGLLDRSRAELARRIVGQGEIIDGLLTALIAGGHILLEGVPGLAKTLAVRSLAEITALQFKRIQFTPDLLPADITGTLMWEQNTGQFRVRRGPVFANLILADEINRAPAKVQSALLEAMEERQVTIGETTYPLPEPFLVLATQNPIEHEGTYNLPEAQLDRFFLKLLVPYPRIDEEARIVEQQAAEDAEGVSPLSPVLDPPRREALRAAVRTVRIDPRITGYLVSVVAATRPPVSKGGGVGVGSSRSGEGERRQDRDGLCQYIAFGASPRASIALYQCCRIRALFEGRAFVTPEDVKAAAFPVLRHRIVLSYEAEADGLDTDGVISRILALVPAP
ncbi:MAG: MoxR family ATPase [Spirochaetaceae bacterium]|jgi:MoxR-like ATPase|nr:MoxR family ATPase [Spirochaetaceae bacterium]